MIFVFQREQSLRARNRRELYHCRLAMMSFIDYEFRLVSRCLGNKKFLESSV